MSTQNKLKLRFLGQLFGALGVIASLIFVAWEIRQNTETVKSATIQDISEQSFSGVSLLVQNDKLREAFYLSLDAKPLTTEQEQHLRVWYGGSLRIWMNRYLQSRLGILDQETAVMVGGQSSRAYKNPFFSKYWADVQGRYPEEFVQFF